jgi:hypothetical protein
MLNLIIENSYALLIIISILIAGISLLKDDQRQLVNLSSLSLVMLGLFQLLVEVKNTSSKELAFSLTVVIILWAQVVKTQISRRK